MTCRLLSSSDCMYFLRTIFLGDQNWDSGVVSTAVLWMVDVDKSRVECEDFIVAEGNRHAFRPANNNNVLCFN